VDVLAGSMAHVLVGMAVVWVGAVDEGVEVFAGRWWQVEVVQTIHKMAHGDGESMGIAGSHKSLV
jgi:hypothetical protein